MVEDHRGPSGAGGAPGGDRRPRDLAILLLAMGGGPPRQRARDQQADLAGGDLNLRVLDRVAAIDPEPEECEAALARIVDEIGEPTGPTRGLCVRFKQEWEECRASPGSWSWLMAEALEAGNGVVRRRRGRGPEIDP